MTRDERAWMLAGNAGGGSGLERRAAGLCKQRQAAFNTVITGPLSQVSKLCGSKFQVAFRLQKQHFQVPADAFHPPVLSGSRGMKWHESVRFTMFWGLILRMRAQPGSVQALCMLTKIQPCCGVTAPSLGRLLIN